MNAWAARLLGGPMASEEARTASLSQWLLPLYFGLSFVMGLLDHVTVRLVGLMPVNEILLAGLLTMALLCVVLYQRLPGPLASPGLLTIFLIAQLIGLVSYIFADLYRGSASGDMIRGWSRMVFLAINILAFSLLFGASSRCFLFLQFGLICSFAGSVVEGPMFGEYWKFAFAYPITTAILLATPRWFGFHASIAACFFLAGLQSVMDFRSLGGVCACVGILLALRYFPPNWRRLILLSGAVVALALAPAAAHHALSSAGERGTRSNVERSAMLQAAWEAFYRSPIIGQGSWFSQSNVMDEFLLIRAENSRLAGVGGYDDTDFEGIAIHSQILVALAEGGIFGATFFFVYGAFIIWGIWFCLVRAPWHWLMPVRLFILIVAFWNLLMSPFSGPHRVEIALAVGLILMLWRESGQPRSEVTLGVATPTYHPI